MIVKFKNLVILFISACLIFLIGCSGSSAAAITPAAQSTKISSQPQIQEPANQPAAETPAAAINRVDVIYFHVNQRCPTCLCFEEHVNKVIEKYFNDAISNGKLTYKVLNAQLPQNAEIAKKYQVVGSQLFVNTITNGIDHIENIDEIWNWNCRNNPNTFELKVKNIIQQSLGGQG